MGTTLSAKSLVLEKVVVSAVALNVFFQKDRLGLQRQVDDRSSFTTAFAHFIAASLSLNDW